ncbi:putative serine/threonine-protein kinase nek2 [Cucumis melo var. makuwa]|uniref:Putative serine/threonine-protein kinase nek2 n=1 Tax=Cucumis melo var. makuwa TaxID=1194695 RepID=A0A5D3BYV3_CUCMM|nr:putative serine/threonine-protein kinase nek2 [Cucumis melo var. makuwa]
MDDLNEEVGVGELNATVEETPKELKRRRGPTIMFDVTRIRSLGDKKVVRYNEDGAPIGENGAKLKSFIGSATHYHVPITYMSWKSVPAELKDKIFTTVEKKGSNEVYVDRAKMWKKARVNKQGQYDNDDIQQVVHKIDEISMNIDSSSVNRHCSNDVLTQALIKKTSKDEANILVENEELRRRVSELEAQIRSNLSTSLSAHGIYSRPIMLEGIEEKGKRIEVESLDKPKQKEKKGKEVIKMNEPELDILKERDLIKMPTEKEVVCESTSTLPLALKSILRYAEKVMEKDSSITFSLSADLFGISRKTSVLREDIVDFCNMNEMKTFILVAYMMYLYSSVIGSKENMQLMVSKPNQVVLAPFNPGGHWALLAINAYEDTVFYLDSLRTTSKATTRYVTDTGFEFSSPGYRYLLSGIEEKLLGKKKGFINACDAIIPLGAHKAKHHYVKLRDRVDSQAIG